MRSAAGCLLLLLFGQSPVFAQAGFPAREWNLKGYISSLLTQSETVFPPGERYALDLSRVRLEIRGNPASHLGVELHYDNEIWLGTYLRTEQFALTKHRSVISTLDLDRNYVDRRNIFARHRLHRASLSWSVDNTDMRVGRQRIAWGTGHFWSPMDILNPLDPNRIEREERQGVDALLIEQKLGPIAKVSGVFAPGTERAGAIAAAYAHGNARGTDYSVAVGNFRGDRVLGVDFSGSIGGVGIHGEATATRSESGRKYVLALLGADYGFASTLKVSGELYHNGQGASESRSYDWQSLFSGRIPNVARWYGAFSTSYEITPLLMVVTYGVLNIDDLSRVVWPSLVYSVASGLDITAGLQLFGGRSGSEYGGVQDVRYLQAKWFF